MILRSHNPQAGLFSHLNFVITHMDTHGGTDFHVDWIEGLPYAEPSRGNLFEHLFQQPAERRADDTSCAAWPHYRYTGSAAWQLYHGDECWRRSLNSCWMRLKVRSEILAEVEAIRIGWPERVVGMHVRNLNIGNECPGGASPTLDDYHQAIWNSEDPVFLATDNDEAVAFFQERLGPRLITRKISRSPDMRTELHLTTRQGFKDARDCLVDALLLASCQHLVHSVSNIATAVLYMNPELAHTVLARGIQIGRGPVDGGDRARSAEFCGAIHVEHPGWQDWIILRSDGVFIRHGVPSEIGRWGRISARRIFLDWANWPREEFDLRNDCYRPGAARNGVNGLNSLCYRLA